jgi:hypothetical protein
VSRAGKRARSASEGGQNSWGSRLAGRVAIGLGAQPRAAWPHRLRCRQGPEQLEPRLHKVLEAPLRGEVGLCPAVVHVHQRDVVACGAGKA